MRRITKCYEYNFYFDIGSAQPVPESTSLELPIMRARMLGGHRKTLIGYEDTSDPRDLDYARLRLDGVLNALVNSGVSVDELELQPQPEEKLYHLGGRFSRRVELTMFPRVKKLGGDGSPFLSCSELRLLDTARELVQTPRFISFSLFRNKLVLLDGYTENTWLRIVGYASLGDWEVNGATHPLFESSDTRDA